MKAQLEMGYLQKRTTEKIVQHVVQFGGSKWVKVVVDLPTGLIKNKLHNGFKMVLVYIIIVRQDIFLFITQGVQSTGVVFSKGVLFEYLIC